MSSDPFPPSDWLGYALDMTSTVPNDIDAVTAAVLSAVPLIKVADGGTPETINGITWTVPSGVKVSADTASAESSYTSYKDGTSAASSIMANASVSASYMAVSVDSSTSYSITKTFSQDLSYALFSFNQNIVHVGLKNWADNINNKFLKARLEQIKPFDPKQPEVVADYRRFFNSLGSHVITGAAYGGRFQLTAWASNSDSSSASQFSQNVAVAYNGLVSGGSFDTGIKTTDEYKTFSQSRNQTSSCRGGDTTLGTALTGNIQGDNVFKTFQAWVNTSKTNPDVMSFQLMALWDVVSLSDEPKVSTRASDIQTAYTWITSNPQTHRTKCRLTINSDWGEIGLITPGAFIIPDSASPYNGGNVQWAIPQTTRITWGTEHSHSFQRDVFIDFLIVNDGSPVDIALSHGSDGSAPGTGNIIATINGTSYTNSTITDNTWNLKIFPRCEVNPNAEVGA